MPYDCRLAAIESQLRWGSIKVIPVWWNPALRSCSVADYR